MTQTETKPERNALGETRQRIIVRRIIITAIVLACIAGLAVAANRTRRGDDDTSTSGGSGASPSIVEQLQPRDGDTLVNQQAQVGIDLTTPYRAFLIVDGTQIPDDQLLKRPELAAVYFTPGEDKVIKALPAGRNCVQAVISRVDGTLETVPPVTWCFNVA